MPKRDNIRPTKGEAERGPRPGQENGTSKKRTHVYIGKRPTSGRGAVLRKKGPGEERGLRTSMRPEVGAANGAQPLITSEKVLEASQLTKKKDPLKEKWERQESKEERKNAARWGRK